MQHVYETFLTCRLDVAKNEGGEEWWHERKRLLWTGVQREVIEAPRYVWVNCHASAMFPFYGSRKRGAWLSPISGTNLDNLLVGKFFLILHIDI